MSDNMITCAYDEVMRLRDTLSFSDVTLSVLK